jgi:hypothetical protein
MEQIMTLYWTSVEFDIPDPSAYEDCVGGFVYLFFNASGVRGAIPIIETAIKEEGLRLNTIEFVSPYDEVPWDSKEEQLQYDSLAKEAKEGETVVWDEIVAYESKEE